MQFVDKKQIITINTLLSIVGKKRGFKYEKREKADLILKYSEGRTDTTTGLYYDQARELISDLNKITETAEAKSEERMKRNIIAMAHEMNWELPDGKIDIERINGWCAHYGYLNKTHHRLDDYKLQELPALVSQFKKVYHSYLKNI